jgi:hypothetical protein
MNFSHFLARRHLWTLPGRKQCMWSSSFPHTITIPNFEPISLTVLEFWKRYYRKSRNIVFFGTFQLVEWSSAAEILRAGLFGLVAHHNNKGSKSQFLVKTARIFRCVYWATQGRKEGGKPVIFTGALRLNRGPEELD